MTITVNPPRFRTPVIPSLAMSELSTLVDRFRDCVLALLSPEDTAAIMEFLVQPERNRRQAATAGGPPGFQEALKNLVTEETTVATDAHLQVVLDGDLRAVVQMLDGGVSANAANGSGDTFMHCAVQKGHVHVIEELSRRGGNLRAKTKYGYTPMHWAAINCDAAVIEAIMHLCDGGGASDVDNTGWSALHWLAERASDYRPPARADAALAALVQCTDLNFSAKNRDGRTAACVAREADNEAFAIKLEQVP